MSEPAPATPAAEPVAPATPAPTPVAPASGTEPTPAQPTETKPAEGATAEQVAKYLGTDVATLEKFKTFSANNGENGKFDNMFAKAKEAITARPQPKVEPQTNPNPQPQPQAPQNGSQKATGPMNGIYSMQEIAMMDYFDRISQDPKYENISSEIRNGDVLVQAKKLGINILTPNGVNDSLLRDFLNMYSASKPAVPSKVEPTADTQIDYVKVDEIKSMEDANKIELQDIQLRNQGLPGHPKAKEAREFVKNYYKNKK